MLGPSLSFDCSGDVPFNSQFFPAYNLQNHVEKQVAPTAQFSHVTEGITFLNLDSAKNGGGATNPDGTYFSVLMPSSSLPTGACDEFGDSFMSGVPLCFSADLLDNERKQANGYLYTFSSSSQQSTDLTWSTIYGSTDVLAITTCSPSPVKYYGYDIIITSRSVDDKQKVDLETNCDKSGKFWCPGINFADPVNSVNGGIDSTSESRPIVVLISPDSKSTEIVRKGYIDLGFPAADINVIELDQEIFRAMSYSDAANPTSWVPSKPDVMHELFRASILGEAFNGPDGFKNASWPVVHYHGRPSIKSTPFKPIPRKRETGYDEKSELGNKFDSFVEEIGLVMAKDGYGVEKVMQMDNIVDGGLYDSWNSWLSTALHDGAFPAGTRDATYSVTFIEGNVINQSSRYVITGVNHVRSAIKARYQEIGINVYNKFGKIVYTEWIDDSVFERSGEGLVDGNGSDASLFFAVEFAKDCTDSKLSVCYTFDFNMFQNPQGWLAAGRVYGAGNNWGLGVSVDEVVDNRVIEFRIKGKEEVEREKMI